MGLFKTIAELSDVVSLAVYCADDGTFMLISNTGNNELWIPSTKIVCGNSWRTQSNLDLKDIFGEQIIGGRLLRVCKVWTPHHTVTSIYHCIYEVMIPTNLKNKSKNSFGKYRGKIRWVNETELVRLSYQENLKSPELVEYILMIKGSNRKTKTMLPENYENTLPSEYMYHGTLLEINENVVIKTPSNIYEQIVSAAEFTNEIQINIYREFLLICYPSLYMCLGAFTTFMMKFGWVKVDFPFLFRAADISGRGGLSFREFMYFLAAVEPGTTHGGGAAELRCRYIFRFYDRDRDNLINFNEFKTLILHLRKSKKQPLDAASVNKDAEQSFKAMNPSAGNSASLTIADFLHAVGNLKLRGTSQILRSSQSIQKYLKTVSHRDSKLSLIPFDKNAKAAANAPAAATTGANKARQSIYELAVHTVKLQKSGTQINVDQIWNMNAAVSFSSTNQPTLNSNDRRGSMDQFSQKSLTNEILKGLRYLTQINKNKPGQAGRQVKRTQFLWGQLDSFQFSRHLINLCELIKIIMKSEPRMLELHSPVYIMGDLHGNFADLLYFEKVLWHLGPGLCPSSLLFLGDYVDRGQYSMEVIAYLFAYKVQTPKKVSLLRGNHEIREIQKMFTFYTECCSKFGDKTGNDVWNAVNNAFDVMPLAATVDGKIFCCHGGIPPPWLCPVVGAINSIPVPLSHPHEQSSLAWEIMWNDPVRQNNVTEALAMELMANEGFAVNGRRGTAHIFSADALEKFLHLNGLTHIVRAHEVAQAGFHVLQRGKLLTVFSSSKYCGGTNEAACILADQCKLRILRLETS